MRRTKPFILLILLAALGVTSNMVQAAPMTVALSDISSGDTAWVMTASVLVLLMTLPGLALFYGGMVRKKNILNTMMYSFSAAALVSVLWMIVGYSLALMPGNQLIGSFERFFLSGMGVDLLTDSVTVLEGAGSLPESVYMFFQMTFAIIAVAIISGAVVERMKYSAMMWFSGAWLLLVYVPVCYWVWGGGFMHQGGVLDYAGGTVVHINAGVAALVASIVLGPRLGYGKESMPPHNMALTLTGAALLWVGWFGFNAGSALKADASAGMALAVTQIAAAAGALTWPLCEYAARHRPSALGLASGAVAGLVGITPAAGFVGAPAALLIGSLTAALAYFASVILKRRLGYDDALDAFGIHGFGGIVGAMLTGLLFSNRIFGGELEILPQLWIQLKDVVITVVYGGIMSLIILKVIEKFAGSLRVSRDMEREGLDINIHGERVE